MWLTLSSQPNSALNARNNWILFKQRRSTWKILKPVAAWIYTFMSTKVESVWWPSPVKLSICLYGIFWTNVSPIICTLGSFAKLRDQELLYDISLACEGQIMPAHQVLYGTYFLPILVFSMSAHHAVWLCAFQRERAGHRSFISNFCPNGFKSGSGSALSLQHWA